MSPRFSAVLINYNHGAYIAQALDAALNQTVPFDEVLIVDDASTDDSVALIEARIRDLPQARLVRNARNMGINTTLNIGTREATGDFIFIISADDRYSLEIVEWCKQAAERFPDAAMICGNARIWNVATGRERVFLLPFPQVLARYTRADMAGVAQHRNFTFYGGATIMNRQAMLELGGHLEALAWHADWFLYLLLACRYPFAVIPHECITVRQAEEQYSHACHDWKQQRPVIAALIHTLQKDYPDTYDFFRNSALLPTYDIQALFLLLGDKTLRHYLTPLLAWRLLTYKPLRAIGRLLPDDLRARIRILLRV